MVNHVVQGATVHLRKCVASQRFSGRVCVGAMLALIHQEHGHTGLVQDSG